MAQRAAVANGNWSLASTWNGGVLPVPGDVVASNNFTVTIDQNINVDSISNTANTISNAIPAMTSNTTPSGIASASTFYGVGYEAFRAFLNVNSSSPFVAGSAPFWLAYEFTSPKVIDSYAIMVGIGFNAANTMRDWTFEGWDGTSWVVLHTVTNYLTASWNSSNYTSPTSIGNTTAYIRYRFNCTAANAGAIYVTISFVRWYEYLSTTSVAGGGFVLNNGVTVTCTGTGVVTGTTTCLTYSGSGVSTINASIFPANASAASNVSGLIYSGSGTLNLNGNILNIALSIGRGPTVLFSGTGTLNVTGNIDALQVLSALRITNTSICNIVGNLNPGNSAVAVEVTGNATVNITGNIFPQLGGSSGASILLISAAAAVVTLTGNVFSDTVFNEFAYGIRVTGTSRLNVIGSVFSGYNTTFNAINAGTNCYISVIGLIKSSRGTCALISTGGGAINMLTGPFISGDSGILPLYVTRMHYRRTLGSYYEFRDSSTNGALPPAAAAPATRLNSPEVGSDLPVVTDVRFGTTYGYGSLVGTLRMPTANQVTYGVAVDNTFGAAVLTAASVWDYLVDNITTANSIGLRLKNVSTPQTVGSQLASLL